MTGFLQRLLAHKVDPTQPSAGTADTAQLQFDLKATRERISALEGDLEGMEAELAKAEVERGQIENLTNDMAASQVRAAATVG